MNGLIINENSDFNVHVKLDELERLNDMKFNAIAIQTSGHRSGPSVILSREQIIELRDWINNFLMRTS